MTKTGIQVTPALTTIEDCLLNSVFTVTNDTRVVTAPQTGNRTGIDYIQQSNRASELLISRDTRGKTKPHTLTVGILLQLLDFIGCMALPRNTAHASWSRN